MNIKDSEEQSSFRNEVLPQKVIIQSYTVETKEKKVKLEISNFELTAALPSELGLLLSKFHNLETTCL